MAFARGRGILCQGRGSAASSAVCYALGITAVDAVFYRLPFERFISAHRDEEPDIDVDFDSDRREEVIQWVYDTYGRHNAAQVANVITYRPRMAVRDAAKALGYSSGQQDAWSKQIDGWTSVVTGADGRRRRRTTSRPRSSTWPSSCSARRATWASTPAGWCSPSARSARSARSSAARMDRRTVLQWDKDACETMGLVKFDLLGLGMLGALDHMMRLAAEHLGESWTLATMPKEEPEVYDMLCRADSIGVFQVESRAQIGTLPRLRPREFYDLAIEIALIRPGPIQGGAVHPYIRRATGKEPVTYEHPDLVPVLERTRGVPLFQEQLMAMAVALGDCTRDDADLLRRAMGSKRGVERIESIKEKLYAGMARRGLVGDRADAIYVKILSFANFGFAESPRAELRAARLRQLLVQAALPRGVPGRAAAQPADGLLLPAVAGRPTPAATGWRYAAPTCCARGRRPGWSRSGGAVAGVRWQRIRGADRAGGLLPGLLPAARVPRRRPRPDPDAPSRRRAGRAGSGWTRCGASAPRWRSGSSPPAPRWLRRRTDLSRRADLSPAQLEALATAGAFASFGLDRRAALWGAGFAEKADHIAGSTSAPDAPALPAMGEVETTLADLWATGVSTQRHPVEHLRAELSAAGILAVGDLGRVEHGRRVHVGGLITHRQRPGTAGGVTFLNVEDETGMLNVVCSVGVMRAHRTAARHRVAVVVRGILEHQEGATNLVADRVVALDTLVPGAGAALQARQSSRDFR